jgi:hypothetical protein
MTIPHTSTKIKIEDMMEEIKKKTGKPIHFCLIFCNISSLFLPTAKTTSCISILHPSILSPKYKALILFYQNLMH